MKHGKKIRRGAILALVLVLLLNTMGVQAGTGAPEITVSTYAELITAIGEASNLDTILIGGVIEIPEGASLGDSSKVVILKSSGGYMQVVDEPSATAPTSLTNLIFDGARRELLAPYLRLTGEVQVIGCTFKNCGAYGAVNTSYTEGEFTGCTFKDNKGTYGAHVGVGYNTNISFTGCSFTGGVATVRGGGVYLNDPTSTATITDCLITGNSGAYGGGIANWGSVTVRNTLIYGNTASVGGADLFSAGSYDLETIENMADLYHKEGLEPLSWENDYTDPDYGATCLKLTYEAYTAPTPDPEPTPEPDPEPTPDPDEEGSTGGDTGDNTGGDTGNTDPITPPSEGDNTGDSTDPSTPPSEDNTNPDEGGDTGNTDPSTPSGGNTGGDTNNSNTDNSSTDNSTTDNSTHTEDNSGSGNSTSNTTTTTNSSTTDNHSSSTQSTDNHSSHSSTTDNSYKDNSSSTVNNYYQQEAPVASQNGSQPVNVSVPVNITVPKQNEADTGTTEDPEQATTVPQDIKIEAEGVDLVYEYTEDGVSISIKASKKPESTDPAVTTISTPVMAPEQAESPQESPNWVEIVTMILLAVLVLAELRDKIRAN